MVTRDVQVNVARCTNIAYDTDRSPRCSKARGDEFCDSHLIDSSAPSGADQYPYRDATSLPSGDATAGP